MPPIRPGHRLPPPPPPPPPRCYHRYHHRHDDWFFGGLGIGLIIGALSNSGSSGSSGCSAQRDCERRAEEVRRAARETADMQSAHLVEIISRIGSQSALYELNEYWQAQGQTTSLDTGDPVRSLRVSGFREDLTIVYRLDRAVGEETVTVSAPAYNVSESASARYREPQGMEAQPSLRAQPPAPKPKPPHKMAGAFGRLGFTLDENARTPKGHLIVQSVDPSSVAARTGMAKGATLYRIDGNTTAQVSVEQLCAFIERRAAAGASVKLVFSDGGKQKTVKMQL